MKREKKTPEPNDAKRVETFGGDYHRLESHFRPAEKTPRTARAAQKRRAPDKTAQPPAA